MKKRRYVVVLGQPKLNGPWRDLKLDMSLIGESRPSWRFKIGSKKEAIVEAAYLTQYHPLWTYNIKEVK